MGKKSALKSAQKRSISCNFYTKSVHFRQISFNFLQFLLIFALIFRPKTNKSYKITLFTTANHPIFQNFLKNILFPPIF